MRVDFKAAHDNVTFHGRNGTGKCRGVNLWLNEYTDREPDAATITIQPVTSKGNGANCSIDIPLGDADEVIRAMHKVIGPNPLMVQMRQALGHALQRLNAIPHRYADTNFKLIEKALLDAVIEMGPDEDTPSHIVASAQDIKENAENPHEST